MWPRRKQEQGGPPFSQLADTASDQRRGASTGGVPVTRPWSFAKRRHRPGWHARVKQARSLRTTVKNRLLNDMICAFGKELFG